MIDEDTKDVIATIMAVVVLVAMSYLATAGILWLVCLCFGWEWSWLMALGVWIALAGIKAAFGRR